MRRTRLHIRAAAIWTCIEATRAIACERRSRRVEAPLATSGWQYALLSLPSKNPLMEVRPMYPPGMSGVAPDEGHDRRLAGDERGDDHERGRSARRRLTMCQCSAPS